MLCESCPIKRRTWQRRILETGFGTTRGIKAIKTIIKFNSKGAQTKTTSGYNKACKETKTVRSCKQKSMFALPMQIFFVEILWLWVDKNLSRLFILVYLSFTICTKLFFLDNYLLIIESSLFVHDYFYTTSFS